MSSVPDCRQETRRNSERDEMIIRSEKFETKRDGLTIRGSNQVERRLGTGVTTHHTEDDVVKWLNAIFKDGVTL